MTVAVFNGIVMLLVGIILAVRRVVVGTGDASIAVEGRAPFRTPLGLKLSVVLADAGISIPAACGGRGTCGLCRVRVKGDVSPPLATETALLDAHAIAHDVRLACQVTVRGDIAVGLVDGGPSAGHIEARVRSSRNLTATMKEITLELPEGTPFEFRAGGFVQITCPPYARALEELPVDDAYRAAWDRLGVAGLVASCTAPTTRAYSLANHSGEVGVAMLVVRIALPPTGAPAGTPPGVVSSYLFGLRPGDTVQLTGPFGHFVARDTDKEMVFVGGGAGMAPMRAHILEQLLVLKSKRRISFWYGARSRADLFYEDEFEALAEAHENFTWSVALSEPAPEDAWTGATGFIHQHLLDAYLAKHENPADCEYYLCGPPLMVRAVVAMLESLGVDRANILFDDFGV